MYIANRIIATGATSIVFEGTKAPGDFHLPPGRVCIKVLKAKIAVMEARKYLLINNGYGEFIDLVNMDDVKFNSKFEELLNEHLGGDCEKACLILKLHLGESFIWSQPLKTTKTLKPGTWIIAIQQEDGLDGYIQGFIEFSTKDRVNFILSLIEEIQRFHSNGHVHGDISPQNIMLVDGKPKLIDYGGELTLGSPGWSSGSRGVNGDIHLLGLWISRAFKGLDPPLERIGRAILEGQIKKLPEIKSRILLALKKQQIRRSRLRMVAILFFFIASSLIVSRFSSNDYHSNTRTTYRQIYDNAIDNPRSAYDSIEKLLKAFNTDITHRHEIFEYLKNLGSKEQPPGNYCGLLSLNEDSGVFIGKTFLRPGDALESGRLFDIYPSQIRIKGFSSKPLIYREIDAPFQQIQFGAIIDGADFNTVFWTICRLLKKDYINLKQNDHARVSIFMETNNPREIFDAIIKHEGVVGRFEDDIIVNDYPEIISIVEFPRNFTIKQGSLNDLVTTVNKFSNFQIIVSEELKNRYVPRVVLQKPMTALEVLNLIASSIDCQIEASGEEITISYVDQ